MATQGNKLKLGTCIKNIKKEVLFQDELCLEVCGKMLGAVCDKGCMSNYAGLSGMTLIKNSENENNIVDAVVINDGKTLTTLFYMKNKNEEARKEEIERLKSHGLSKSEMSIFILVMDGWRNSQIAKELFISKGTLKTHLNNIYKKLPENYQKYKNRQ